MITSLSFTIVYGCMIFIWTFVYLNKSHNKINQSFLYFLSALVIWMALSDSNDPTNLSVFGLVLKTIYWYVMLGMSVLFLLFIYRLVKKNLDAIFFAIAATVILTIGARYLFPIDYTDPVFWRLSHPIVAPLMATIFSSPAVYAAFLVIKEFVQTKDKHRRAQFANIFFGTGTSVLISVVSEYILPVWFHINLQIVLMHYATFAFVVFLFVSIMKHRLLNIEADYIYSKLFLNSNEGIIIVKRNSRIININRRATEILGTENLATGELLTDYLKDYRFHTDYIQQEMVVQRQGQPVYLSLTQSPIDTEPKAAKLLTITDISAAKLQHQQEKNMLLERALLDPLTGAYNKQYLLEKHGATPAQPRLMSLLFIDVDDFKAINDEFGHLFGDYVLKELVACIRGSIRETNEVIRYGGDEFIVLLDHTKVEQAYSVAERVRDAVTQTCFPAENSVAAITVSIGVIEGFGSIRDLLIKADKAMYRSKEKGKNTVTLFREEDR